MSDIEEETAQAILEKLNEICLWLRFSSRKALRDVVESVLRDDRDRMIYELTNGKNSTTDISKKVGYSQPAISRIWNRWKKVGIVTEVSGIQGRCKVLCTLDELGIELKDAGKASNDVIEA